MGRHHTSRPRDRNRTPPPSRSSRSGTSADRSTRRGSVATPDPASSSARACPRCVPAPPRTPPLLLAWPASRAAEADDGRSAPRCPLAPARSGSTPPRPAASPAGSCAFASARAPPSPPPPSRPPPPPRRSPRDRVDSLSSSCTPRYIRRRSREARSDRSPRTHASVLRPFACSQRDARPTRVTRRVITWANTSCSGSSPRPCAP